MLLTHRQTKQTDKHTSNTKNITFFYQGGNYTTQTQTIIPVIQDQYENRNKRRRSPQAYQKLIL